MINKRFEIILPKAKVDPSKKKNKNLYTDNMLEKSPQECVICIHMATAG